MTADATSRAPSRHLWTKNADQVRRRAGRAIWHAAEAAPDPLAAIETARRRAEEVIDRLLRAAGAGEHLLTCLARGDDGAPGLAADLALSRRGGRCPTDWLAGEGAGTTFGALLLLGALTGEPVGIVLRSCHDPRHTAEGHQSTVRGWLLHDHFAQPLSRGAIRTVVRGGRAPHPALPPHPEEGTTYEKAYSLYTAGEEL